MYYTQTNKDLLISWQLCFIKHLFGSYGNDKIKCYVLNICQQDCNNAHDCTIRKYFILLFIKCHLCHVKDIDLTMLMMMSNLIHVSRFLWTTMGYADRLTHLFTSFNKLMTCKNLWLYKNKTDWEEFSHWCHSINMFVFNAIFVFLLNVVWLFPFCLIIFYFISKPIIAFWSIQMTATFSR